MTAQRAAIISDTIVNGGGTYFASTLEPVVLTGGYVVATAPGTAARLPVEQADRLPQVATLVAHEWDSSMVGTWVSKGVIHVDPVVVVVSRDQAVDLGRQLGQQAIRDVRGGCDIPL